MRLRGWTRLKIRRLCSPLTQSKTALPLLLLLMFCCCCMQPAAAIRVAQQRGPPQPCGGLCAKRAFPAFFAFDAAASRRAAAAHAAAAAATAALRLRPPQQPALVPAAPAASRPSSAVRAGAAAGAEQMGVSAQQGQQQRQHLSTSAEAATAAKAAAAGAGAAAEGQGPLLFDGSIFKGASVFAAEPLGFQKVMRGYDKSLALEVKPPQLAQNSADITPPDDPIDSLLNLSSSSSNSSSSSSGSGGGELGLARQAPKSSVNSGATTAATAATAAAAAGEEASRPQASAFAATSPTEGAAAAAADGAAAAANGSSMSVFTGLNFETYFGAGVRYQRMRDGFLVYPPIFPDRMYFLQPAKHLQQQQQQKQQHQQQQQQQQDERRDPRWVEATPAAAVTRKAAAAAAAVSSGAFGAPEFELGGPHGVVGAPGLTPSRAPSYLNPQNPFLRTGRMKDKERKENDSGPQQRTLWNMDEVEGDIPRGPLGAPNDRYKELVDSVDWSREHPTLQDRNYYKRRASAAAALGIVCATACRSFFETGLHDVDRNTDSYFDPQFVGAPDAFPYAANAGPLFTWQLRWVPWLCKKHGGGRPPIKSECFCLGGVEPLQLWFYPDGLPSSLPGFCALKLVTRPGWHLPFPINLWIKGAPPLPAFKQQTNHQQQQKQQQQREEEQQEAAKGRRRRRKKKEETGSLLPPDVSQRFTKPSQVSTGPVWRESAECVAFCQSFCRLLDKGSYGVSASPPLPPSVAPPPGHSLLFNEETDVVLNAFGGVEVGVAVAHAAWDWDDGAWDMEQWLKRQSAYPDDEELENTLPPDFTHSPYFENFKYDDVPDKHFFRYLPSSLPPNLQGERLEAALLQPTSSYCC
ncbi:hypothetical protein Esti_006871 [Eimeria stiedai]